MGLFDPIDWNGDGKHDIYDDMIDYSIYRQVMDDNKEADYDSGNSSCPKRPVRVTGKSGGGRAMLAFAVIILSIIGWIYFIVHCCVSCSSSTSGKYSYSRSYKSYSGSSSKSGGSAYSYQSKTTSSAVQPTTKKPTYKSYSSKSKSSRFEDEYSAKDYVDADDFYYDHYDDFYDYEDAEDYYNEHN